MIRSYRGSTPRIHPSAFVDASAQVIGDVEIGDESSVWMCAVLRGDVELVPVPRGELDFPLLFPDPAWDAMLKISPAAALAAGADHLVVGRPIVAAPDPKAAADAIIAEIAGVMP